MNDYIKSTLITIGAVFLLAFLDAFASGGSMEWTVAGIVALSLAGLRAGIKAVYPLLVTLIKSFIK